MSTLYHRLPVLDPNLKRVGFGRAALPNGLWTAVLDVKNGK